jgi:hypothetical protein
VLHEYCSWVPGLQLRSGLRSRRAAAGSVSTVCQRLVASVSDVMPLVQSSTVWQAVCTIPVSVHCAGCGGHSPVPRAQLKCCQLQQQLLLVAWVSGAMPLFCSTAAWQAVCTDHSSQRTLRLMWWTQPSARRPIEVLPVATATASGGMGVGCNASVSLDCCMAGCVHHSSQRTLRHLSGCSPWKWTSPMLRHHCVIVKCIAVLVHRAIGNDGMCRQLCTRW